MSWKQRLYASLPYVLVLLGAAGIAVTEEVWLAMVSLVGMWFLPSPLTQSDVSRETSSEPNVSRETLSDPKETVAEYILRTTPNYQPKGDLPLPCPIMHGSADPHVLGCEGWRSPELGCRMTTT